MTRDDIIRMAEQSQMNLCWGDVVFTGTSNLERFAALVTAETGKEIAALREERRRDMAEIYSLRESEESLREENERLREDAERYRWVRDYALAIDLAADPDNFVQVWVGTDPARVFRGKTLDDAIDAAMKQAALRREEDKT